MNHSNHAQQICKTDHYELYISTWKAPFMPMSTIDTSANPLHFATCRSTGLISPEFWSCLTDTA